MLHCSEMTGWLALLFATIHYRELTVENALAAARGHVKFQLQFENVTPDKVCHIARFGINNIKNMQYKLKLSQSTIMKIYILLEVSMAGRKKKYLTGEEAEKIKKIIETGLTYKEIKEKYDVSYHVQYRLRNGYDYHDNPNRKSNLGNETFKEDTGRELMRAAKKYWNTFELGDDVILKIKPKKRVQPIKLSGKIVYMCKDYMYIAKNNKKIQIHFSDVLAKTTKIKKNLTNDINSEKSKEIPRVNLHLENNMR